MAHLLDAVSVLDPDGRAVRLGDLWRRRTAVLVFVRHFGCMFCRQQVASMLPLVDEIRALGAELIVIGHGTLEQTRAFRDEFLLGPGPRGPSTPRGEPAPPARISAPGVVLLTDPSRQAYRALEMRRDRRSVMTPGVLARSAKAWWQGFRQTGIAGDPFQQGGVLIVAPGGIERYRYTSRTAGDHPPPRDILETLHDFRSRPAEA